LSKDSEKSSGGGSGGSQGSAPIQATRSVSSSPSRNTSSASSSGVSGSSNPSSAGSSTSRSVSPSASPTRTDGAKTGATRTNEGINHRESLSLSREIKADALFQKPAAKDYSGNFRTSLQDFIASKEGSSGTPAADPGKSEAGGKNDAYLESRLQKKSETIKKITDIASQKAVADTAEAMAQQETQKQALQATQATQATQDISTITAQSTGNIPDTAIPDSALSGTQPSSTSLQQNFQQQEAQLQSQVGQMENDQLTTLLYSSIGKMSPEQTGALLSTAVNIATQDQAKSMFQSALQQAMPGQSPEQQSLISQMLNNPVMTPELTKNFLQSTIQQMSPEQKTNLLQTMTQQLSRQQSSALMQNALQRITPEQLAATQRMMNEKVNAASAESESSIDCKDGMSGPGTPADENTPEEVRYIQSLSAGQSKPDFLSPESFFAPTQHASAQKTQIQYADAQLQQKSASATGRSTLEGFVPNTQGQPTAPVAEAQKPQQGQVGQGQPTQGQQQGQVGEGQAPSSGSGSTTAPYTDNKPSGSGASGTSSQAVGDGKPSDSGVSGSSSQAVSDGKPSGSGASGTSSQAVGDGKPSGSGASGTSSQAVSDGKPSDSSASGSSSQAVGDGKPSGSGVSGSSSQAVGDGKPSDSGAPGSSSQAVSYGKPGGPSASGSSSSQAAQAGDGKGATQGHSATSSTAASSSTEHGTQAQQQAGSFQQAVQSATPRHQDGQNQGQPQQDGQGGSGGKGGQGGQQQGGQQQGGQQQGGQQQGGQQGGQQQGGQQGGQQQGGQQQGGQQQGGQQQGGQQGQEREKTQKKENGAVAVLEECSPSVTAAPGLLAPQAITALKADGAKTTVTPAVKAQTETIPGTVSMSEITAIDTAQAEAAPVAAGQAETTQAESSSTAASETTESTEDAPSRLTISQRNEITQNINKIIGGITEKDNISKETVNAITEIFKSEDLSLKETVDLINTVKHISATAGLSEKGATAISDAILVSFSDSKFEELLKDSKSLDALSNLYDEQWWKPENASNFWNSQLELMKTDLGKELLSNMYNQICSDTTGSLANQLLQSQMSIVSNNGLNTLTSLYNLFGSSGQYDFSTYFTESLALATGTSTGLSAFSSVYNGISINPSLSSAVTNLLTNSGDFTPDTSQPSFWPPVSPGASSSTGGAAAAVAGSGAAVAVAGSGAAIAVAGSGATVAATAQQSISSLEKLLTNLSTGEASEAASALINTLSNSFDNLTAFLNRTANTPSEATVFTSTLNNSNITAFEGFLSTTSADNGKATAFTNTLNATDDSPLSTFLEKTSLTAVASTSFTQLLNLASDTSLAGFLARTALQSILATPFAATLTAAQEEVLSQFLNKTSQSEALATPFISTIVIAKDGTVAQFLNKTSQSEALATPFTSTLTTANNTTVAQFLNKTSQSEALATPFTSTLTTANNTTVVQFLNKTSQSEALATPFTSTLTTANNSTVVQFLNKALHNEGLASPLNRTLTKTEENTLSRFLNRTSGSEALSPSMVKSITAIHEQHSGNFTEKRSSQESLTSSFVNGLTKSNDGASRDLNAPHRASHPATLSKEAPEGGKSTRLEASLKPSDEKTAHLFPPSAPNIRSQEQQPRQTVPERFQKPEIPGEPAMADLQSPESVNAETRKEQPAEKGRERAEKSVSGHFEGSRNSQVQREPESRRPYEAREEKAQRNLLPRDTRHDIKESHQPESIKASRLQAPSAEKGDVSKPGASEHRSSINDSHHQGGSSISEHKAQSTNAPAQSGLMASLPENLQHETLKNTPSQESRTQPMFGQQESQSGRSQAAPFDSEEDKSFTRSAAGTLREEKTSQERSVITGNRTVDKKEEVTNDSSASDDQDQSQDQRSGGKRQEREQQEKNQHKNRHHEENNDEDDENQEKAEDDESSLWIATVERQPVPPSPPPDTLERSRTSRAIDSGLDRPADAIEGSENRQRDPQVIPHRLTIGSAIYNIAGFLATGSIIPPGWFGHSEGDSHNSHDAGREGNHLRDGLPPMHQAPIFGMMSSFADWLVSQKASGVEGVSEKFTETLINAFEPLNKDPEIKKILNEIGTTKTIDTETSAKLMKGFLELSRTEEGKEFFHGFMRKIGKDPVLATALLMTMAAAAQTPEGKELLGALQSRIGTHHHMSRALLKIASTAMQTPEGRSIVEAYLKSVMKDDRLVARHLEILAKASRYREFNEYMSQITSHHHLSNLEMNTRINGLHTSEGRDALREFYRNISQDPDSSVAEMWLRAKVSQTPEGLSLLTDYNHCISSHPDIAAHDIHMRTVAINTTEGMAAVTLYNTFMASSLEAASSEMTLREAASVTPCGMDALMRYESLLSGNCELAESEHLLLDAAARAQETPEVSTKQEIAALLEKLRENDLTREEIERFAELLRKELPREQQELLLKLLEGSVGEKQAKLLEDLLGGKLDVIQRQNLASLISGGIDGAEKKSLTLLLASFSLENHGELLQKILRGGLSEDQRKFLTALLDNNLPKAQRDMLIGLLSSHIPHDQKMFILNLLTKPLSNEQRILLLSVLKANLPFEARQALMFLLMKNSSPEEQKIIIRLLTGAICTVERESLLSRLTRNMTARQRSLTNAFFLKSLSHSQKETIIALLAKSSRRSERQTFLKLLAINPREQEKLLIKNLFSATPDPGKAEMAAQFLATKPGGDQKALLDTLAALKEKDLPVARRALSLDPMSGKTTLIASIHGSKLGEKERKQLIQLITAPLQGAEQELFSAALASPLGFQQCSSALLKVTGEQRESLISSLRKSIRGTRVEPGMLESFEIRGSESTSPAAVRNTRASSAGLTVETDSNAARTAKSAEPDYFREMRRTVAPKEGTAGTLMGGRNITQGSSVKGTARPERRIRKDDLDEVEKIVEVYQRDPREIGMTQGRVVVRSERDLAAERRAAEARENSERYFQNERSEYRRIYLDDSDLMKSFKLSSRAYHFVNYIFEDILKRKLGGSEFKSEYFMQYLCLLMRTSGEFTFAHSLRTQTIALNIAKFANITDKKILEQVRLGSVLCNIGELEYHFQDAPKEKMGQIKQFLSEQDFLLAGVLHDIGKIKIPDEILYKPGALTEEEFKTMKMHPVYSEMLLYPVYPLRHLCPVVRGHHEKWDGKGYPDGISGEQIPLAARIIVIADVFDALISDRPYKKGMPWEKVKKIMNEGRGTHFDPVLLDSFLKYITPFYEKG